MKPRFLIRTLMVAAALWLVSGVPAAPAGAGPAAPAGAGPAASPAPSHDHAAPGAPHPLPAAQRAARPGCTPAAIQDVVLSDPVPVDAIRVVMADGSPVTAAAQVTVDSGAFDRVLFVRGGLSHQLLFYPALRSAEFRVSVSPVLATRRGACIDRIELLRQGTAVATVTP